MTYYIFRFRNDFYFLIFLAFLFYIVVYRINNVVIVSGA